MRRYAISRWSDFKLRHYPFPEGRWRRRVAVDARNRHRAYADGVASLKAVPKGGATLCEAASDFYPWNGMRLAPFRSGSSFLPAIETVTGWHRRLSSRDTARIFGGAGFYLGNVISTLFAVI